MVLPAATVTEAGTVAEALLLESETDTPPVGAAPLKVTVPVADVPPVTLAGLTETEETRQHGGRDGERCRLAHAVVARRSRVAETEDVTVPVVTVKVALWCFRRPRVTEAGTVAAALLLESETNTPPVGAAPLKVTVPVAVVLLVTLAGRPQTMKARHLRSR